MLIWHLYLPHQQITELTNGGMFSKISKVKNTQCIGKKKIELKTKNDHNYGDQNGH